MSSNLSSEFYIPKLSKDFYKNYGSIEDTMASEHQITWEAELNPDGSNKIDITRGIALYIKGASFPKKGWPTPEGIWGANQAKKLFIETLRLLKWKVLFFNKQKVIDFYNEVAYKAVEPFILKTQYLTPIAKQIDIFTYLFLRDLGIERNSAQRFAEIFSFIIDIDTAYRYRIQDLFNETTKERLLQDPQKELKRLIDIMKQRDKGQRPVESFTNLVKLINLMLYIPSIKRYFKDTINAIDIKECQMDEADFYWTLFREDYDFGGMNFETRQELLKSYKIPPAFRVEYIK